MNVSKQPQQQGVADTAAIGDAGAWRFLSQLSPAGVKPGMSQAQKDERRCQSIEEEQGCAKITNTRRVKQAKMEIG